MPKSVFLLFLAIIVPAVDAQTLFKCVGDDGKVQISDRSCSPNTLAERLPDRVSVTPQQRSDAQVRAQRLQDEVASSEAEKAVAVSAQKEAEQHQLAITSNQAAAAKAAADEENAITNCVRDVERRGAAQDVKAEMIAACRTAGRVQRSTGMTSQAVNECVVRVERTGASEKEKARQLATCHGGDVQPEHRQASSRKRQQ